jgi:hypothetical protein
MRRVAKWGLIAGVVVIVACCGFAAYLNSAGQKIISVTSTAQAGTELVQRSWTATPTVPIPTPLPTVTVGPTSTLTGTPTPTATLLPKTQTALAHAASVSATAVAKTQVVGAKTQGAAVATGAVATAQASTDAALSDIAKKILIDTALTAHVTVENGKTVARIQYDDSVEFDENSMVATGLRNLIQLTPAVFAGIPHLDLFVLTSAANFTDIYGKTTTQAAMQFTITSALNSKIDWPNFDRKNLVNVLTDANDDSGVIVNPALTKAWVASQNL